VRTIISNELLAISVCNLAILFTILLAFA